VVVAVDPASAAPLMPDDMEDQRRFFESIVYASLPMPVFFLDRPLRKDVWCYFNDPGLRTPFMFAVDERAKAPEMVPGTKSVLTAWSGHPTSNELFEQPDDVIIEKARKDIEIMIPGVGHWIEDTTVVRHPYGVARYSAGDYKKVLDFIDQAKHLKGVSFVSSVLGGTSMEASIASAKAAVARVCQWGGIVS
jgi:protoporphyrinogen oxidase